MKKDKIIKMLKMISKSMRIVDKPMYGMFISHPLTSDIFVPGPDGKLQMLCDDNLDEFIEQKCNLINKDARNVSSIFIHVNKPYRITLLELVQDYIDVKEHSELLKWIWTSTEFPHQTNNETLVELFKRAEPTILMSKEERDFLSKLPNQIKIYRGLQGPKAKKKGLSWTLSKEKAKWFANRWGKNGKVMEAFIKKEFVFMYTDSRCEEELVVNPNHLSKLKEVKV